MGRRGKQTLLILKRAISLTKKYMCIPVGDMFGRECVSDRNKKKKGGGGGKREKGVQFVLNNFVILASRKKGGIF